MKGMGVRKAMGYNMSSITNSPVNGLLYVRGKISAILALAIVSHAGCLIYPATTLTYSTFAQALT